MTLHRSVRRAAAAAFALTLLVAACGGDDDSPDDAAKTTAPTTAAGGSTTTAGDEGSTESTEPEEEGPDVAEAQALAEAVNLTIDDFADGWEAEEPTDDESDDDLDQCFQDVDVDEVEVASAESPTFSITTEGGDRGQVVQTDTIVLDEEASGEALIAEIGTNQFAGCAEDVLLDSFAEDGTDVIDSGLDVVEDQGGLGDEAIGIAGAVTYDAGGTEAQGQLALYFIRTQNVVTGVSIIDIGDVAFQDTLTDLLAQVALRQESEVG